MSTHIPITTLFNPSAVPILHFAKKSCFNDLLLFLLTTIKSSTLIKLVGMTEKKAQIALLLQLKSKCVCLNGSVLDIQKLL